AVIRDVAREIRQFAIAFHERAVLVVAESGRFEPPGAVQVVEHAARGELRERLLDGAARSQLFFADERVQGNSEGRQVGANDLKQPLAAVLAEKSDGLLLRRRQMFLAPALPRFGTGVVDAFARIAVYVAVAGISEQLAIAPIDRVAL